MEEAGPPEHQKVVRIYACMRALYPNKRDLGFTAQSVDSVLAYYAKHFPDTPDELLLATIMPSDGDLTWAGLSIRPRHVARFKSPAAAAALAELFTKDT